MKALTVLIPLVLLTSCGKSESGSKRGKAGFIRENQEIEGKYRAFLRPLNTHLFGMINSGVVTISTMNEKLEIKVEMDDAAGVTHQQGIYEGLSCPGLDLDKNSDGMVDLTEAGALIGKMLVPLDNDLRSQKAGEGHFPSGQSYTYQQSAPLADIMDDLREVDVDLNDNLTKLHAGEELNLAGRVIIVHGAPNLNDVPVSCGVIERIEGLQ